MAQRRAGYTLLELIVVMALIGIVFFFAIPRFEGFFFSDDAKRSSRWLIGKLQALREEAQRTRRLQVLHIELDTGRLWETSEAMTAAEMDRALLRAQTLPGGGRVVSVEFAQQGRANAGRADVRFFGDGHTDRVLIHVKSGDTYTSFLLEPFISQVRMFEQVVGFDDVRL